MKLIAAWIVRKEDRHNKLQHVLTDFKRYENEKDLGEGVIPIHQDTNMYVSEADPGVEQAFLLSKQRQAYLVCIEGKLDVGDHVHLDTRDAVEVCNYLTIAIDASHTCHLKSESLDSHLPLHSVSVISNSAHLCLIQIKAGKTEDQPLLLKAHKHEGAHFLVIEMALA